MLHCNIVHDSVTCDFSRDSSINVICVNEYAINHLFDVTFKSSISKLNMQIQVTRSPYKLHVLYNNLYVMYIGYTLSTQAARSLHRLYVLYIGSFCTQIPSDVHRVYFLYIGSFCTQAIRYHSYTFSKQVYIYTHFDSFYLFHL